MPVNPSVTFTIAKLEPRVNMPGETIALPIKLLPSLTLALGTVLGEVTPTQTVTITGSPTGGTFTITYNGQTTTGLPYNASAASVQTALIALSTIGTGNATVTGSAGGPYSVVINTAPLYALSASGAGLTGGTSPAATAAFANTNVTSWGYYNSYASGNSDGSQIPKCLLIRPCATDSSGNITEGGQTGGGEWEQTWTQATAYFQGYFETADIVGLDANALLSTVSTRFSLVAGNIKNGILQVG